MREQAEPSAVVGQNRRWLPLTKPDAAKSNIPISGMKGGTKNTLSIDPPQSRVQKHDVCYTRTLTGHMAERLVAGAHDR